MQPILVLLSLLPYCNGSIKRWGVSDYSSFVRPSQVNFRHLARGRRDPCRIFFLRCVDRAGLIFATTQYDVRSTNEYRRSNFSFVVRVERAPYTRFLTVVRQRFDCNVRDSRQCQEVSAQCAIRSIGRAFATFRMFVVHFTDVFFQFVR